MGAETTPSATRLKSVQHFASSRNSPPALIRTFAALWLRYTGRVFKTQDLHVREIVRLSTPRALKAEFPMTEACSAIVALSRERVIRILKREDPRLLVVIG